MLNELRFKTIAAVLFVAACGGKVVVDGFAENGNATSGGAGAASGSGVSSGSSGVGASQSSSSAIEGVSSSDASGSMSGIPSSSATGNTCPPVTIVGIGYLPSAAFLRFDPITGDEQAFVLDPSFDFSSAAYNAALNRYYVLGVSSLTTFDAGTGQVITSVPFNGMNVSNPVVTSGDKLIAIHTMNLAEIDPGTGAINDFASLPMDGTSLAPSGSAIDVTNDVIYQIDHVPAVLTIDATSGKVLKNLQLDDDFFTGPQFLGDNQLVGIHHGGYLATVDATTGIITNLASYAFGDSDAGQDAYDACSHQYFQSQSFELVSLDATTGQVNYTTPGSFAKYVGLATTH